MKCIGIFSFQPDTIFLWTDKEFEDHLHQLSVKCGLVEPEGLLDDGINTDAVLQFFSPIVTSFQFMADAGNPYSSITTEDGKIIVTKQFNDLVYIAICGDKEESEWYLTKKVHVLYQLVNILYGPSTNLLKPPTKFARLKAWGSLSRLLETWQILSQQEQIFLVEAFERLLVNPTLNNTTLSLLEEALLKANRDGHMLHSLLLVNNKLLGLYSTQCAPELQVSDVLLLTVLIKEKFQYDDPTLPKSVHRTPLCFVPQSMEKATDEILFSRKREDVSAAIPIKPKQRSENDIGNASPKSDVFHSANSSLQREDNVVNATTDDGFHTPRYGTPNDAELRSSSTDTSDSERQDTMTSQGRFEHTEATPPTENDPVNIRPEYFQHNVFLRTVDCPFTPHTAHCILLNKACVLVIISESRCVPFATQIYHSLSTIIYVLNGGVRKHPQDPVSASRLYEKLDMAIRKLIDTIPFQSESPKLKSTVAFLSDLWERTKQAELRQFLENEKRPTLPIGLSGILPKLVETLKALFTLIYLTPRNIRGTRSERLLKVIHSIQSTSRSKLRDFTEFLQVRGQCNVTMTAYINDFPGLVHFMYINRTANLLIAPTINVNNADVSGHSKLPLNLIIKQRLWDIWQYVERHVAKGYTSFIVQDGDFTYSYFLWFEDNMGKALPVQKTPKQVHTVISTGALSGNFYRNLVRQCFDSNHTSTVNCYELLCMHVGVVSKRYVSASAKKLAKWLWETSGEATSPIGLL